MSLDSSKVQSADTRNRVRSRSTHLVWGLSAIALIALGLVGSIVAAVAVAHSASQQSKKTAVESSNQVAATLKLAIQHEDDLVASLQEFFLTNPNASEAQLLQWTSGINAVQRYRELKGFGNVVIVKSAQVPAFAARTPISQISGSNAAFAIVPPGKRSYYCFAVLGVSSTSGLVQSSSQGLPPGFDFCAGGQGQGLLAARDSGHAKLQPLTVPNEPTQLSLLVPIYRSGSTPHSVMSRRENFVGWIGMSVAPAILLSTALAGHSSMAVAFHYASATSSVTFRSGTTTANAYVITSNLHDGWTVQTFIENGAGGLFHNGAALALAMGGIFLSIVLGLLIFILGTGRFRALELVHERTDELQFQALHDPLTRLPNRALILDRIEQMLARARRSHLPAGVMLLDLDNFKDTNDTLGHSAGDQLLVAVGVVSQLHSGEATRWDGSGEMSLSCSLKVTL